MIRDQLQEPKRWVDTYEPMESGTVLTMTICEKTVARAISQPTTLSERKKLYTEPLPKCSSAYFSSALDCENKYLDDNLFNPLNENCVCWGGWLVLMKSQLYDTRTRKQHRPIMIARSTKENDE